MMSSSGFRLSSIRYRGLRNLSPAQLSVDSGLNVFVGANGAGKSALLEALHILATGKSFRATRLRSAVSWGEDGLLLNGRWSSESADYRVGTSCRFDGTRSELMIGNVDSSRLDILKKFPLIFIGAESLKFFEEGPSFRRRQLDMGAFHVEHSYLESWRRYRRALSQRNTILRTRPIPSSNLVRLLSPWDEEMSVHAQKLHRCRAVFTTELQVALADFSAQLGLSPGLTLRLKPGWDPDASLTSQLAASLAKDQSVGYSLRGPHRDDLVLSLNKRNALNAMSRGQQKAFMLAFFLAMSRVIAKVSGHRPVLLLDDLGAELDSAHQKIILDYLAATPFQSFVTLVAGEASPDLPEVATLFHVKHGLVYKCYNTPVISNGPDDQPHVEFNKRYL